MVDSRRVVVEHTELQLVDEALRRHPVARGRERLNNRRQRRQNRPPSHGNLVHGPSMIAFAALGKSNPGPHRPAIGRGWRSGQFLPYIRNI
jgi:hypothetical protein